MESDFCKERIFLDFMNGTRKKPLQANWDKVINMMIKYMSQSQEDDAVSGITDGTHPIVSASSSSAARQAEPAPANLDDAGADVDVVGNHCIAAMEVPDDIEEDERNGDNDLNVRPEPLKSAADIFEMFNQVAVKDGTDDDDIDNLNSLCQRCPGTPLVHL
jgi:hypothetical protein